MADLWETLKERPTGKALRLLVEALVLRSLKESLRGVYLRGEAPEGPLVLALNHHGFFDGHLAWLLGKLCRRPLSLLVAEENLRAYPVLKLAGALEAGRVREALRRLRRGEWVALFPEGEMRYPGPLGPLREGANWLAGKAGVPLLPVALRVVLRGYEHPEAFLWVGRPLPPGGDLGRALGGLLQALDALLAKTHPREVPEGFREVLRGRRSLEERVLPLVRLLRP
ncbi:MULTISPECIES: lysophospholipid acyltransferase family protein [Thermus]|uniref:1-acyl-sn-glycerol-3-phosphate acyltransferase n=3 Tax=Thermus scotoductus TaxID=37636 RepID=A0A430RY82_THESC|nr:MULTISPECIES: lysophospholipid acyltransferase family protein [Thermus]KHG65524.1 glycerol acyltransferase [Thermus sp. 2.9]RTG95573.1 1-acyl-sn-glycerol-3-phosphate acyltransferase [Thermus scotoductus]RTH26017.1 1-acyl-sn-glycerol-3-phosphate acyltransferase [Thermus scotoductus]RTI09199.1 1-acyl-sn-glycerol-3-phosphate acyltransferase [Thermus scotoductus]RTI38988.1 1-acyl-sn-glycerol-3-phosphate acyltransferase [Thermus scotoductus]